jgi:hypothetical protein
LTERECGKVKRKRIRNALRDKPGREPGEMVGRNWRSRPLRDSLILEWDSRRHMSPASSEGIVPFRDNDQEVRRRAESTRDAIKQVARIEQTTREAESRPRVPGFRNLGRTQSVKNR